MQDTYKAELLQIACGLARLPYDESTEFYIKVQYWSCKLLLLKKELGTLGYQLVCSLASDLEYEVEEYCWQTNYPFHLEHPKGRQIAAQWCISIIATDLPESLGTLIQHYLTEPTQAIHTNFDQYLQTFQAGLIHYKCQSKGSWGYRWYKDNTEKNIQGLKKIYPKLSSQKLQKEAIDIAFQLSKQYKIQHWCLLFGYLSCQNRLIQLKISAGVGVGNGVYYRFSGSIADNRSWSRGRK